MSSFDRSAWEARLVEFGMLPGAGRLVLAICRSAGEHAEERARALGLSLRARTALESGKDDYLRQLLGSVGEADYARLLEEAAPILEAACRERETTLARLFGVEPGPSGTPLEALRREEVLRPQSYVDAFSARREKFIVDQIMKRIAADGSGNVSDVLEALSERPKTAVRAPKANFSRESLAAAKETFGARRKAAAGAEESARRAALRLLEAARVARPALPPEAPRSADAWRSRFPKSKVSPTPRGFVVTTSDPWLRIDVRAKTPERSRALRFALLEAAKNLPPFIREESEGGAWTALFPDAFEAVHEPDLADGLPDGVRIAAAPLEDFVLAEGERFRWTLPERLSSAPKRPDPAVRAWLETVRRIERDASAAERLERIAAMSAAARTAADLPVFAK